MLKHFNVLSSAFVLLVGAWAIFHFRQKSRRYPDSRLGDLLRFLVLFNLVELEAFILIYFGNNLTPTESNVFFSWYKGVDWPLRALLLLGMYISLFRVIAWLRRKKLPSGTVPALIAFTAVLMIWFLVDIRFPALLPRHPRINFWNLFIWPLNILGAAWLFRLSAENGPGPEPERRRANRAFARYFLWRIPAVLALVSLGFRSSELWYIGLSRLLIIYTNVIPILWLRSYFAPWAGSLAKIISGRIDMPSLQARHGLSARELEILNLMIDGKSYKEIGTSLHISIHTVKSHVYSLYRKMKVKNRHQLVHLISSSQMEDA